MKISNKYFRAFFICSFLTLTLLNLAVVTNTSFSDVSIEGIMSIAVAQSENPITPGQIGSTERCQLDLGGGWFTSSVEYVCRDQYVCPSCSCTPYACGEHFIL